ncbi:MAG: leucine-rich repeat protein [Paludibacter sp.]|nr:leucine-rich repeat protein [Paludibacter sp.]
MKNFSVSIILLLSFITTFTSCDDDSIFHAQATTSNGVTTISGMRAGGLEKALFLRLSSVTSLVINDTIDSRDFATMRDKMPNLAYIDLSNATIAAYNGFEGSAGTRVYNYSANAIPEFAFYNPETSYGKFKLQGILLPKNLKSIRDYAFNHCGLSGIIEIPASVRDTIGRSAFSFCDGLISVKLSAVKYIGESAFQNCTNLSGTLTIPDSVFTIKPWAFAYCNNLSTVLLPATVSQIGNSAFNGCSGLFNVDPANASFSAINGVLFNVDQTMLVQFPAGKTGSYAVPATVGDIGPYAFANCTGLTSITIPAATYAIEDYAFSGCSGLVGAFPVSSGISSIGQNVFIDCSGITSFAVAPDNSLFSFANGVLIDASQFTIKRCVVSKSGAYIIPSDIMFIDNSAFSNCTSLTSVTIPETILSIGHRAFYNCTGLTSIYAKPTTPVDLTNSSTAFESVNTGKCTLYVPKGAKAAYQSAIGWKNFYNMVEN